MYIHLYIYTVPHLVTFYDMQVATVDEFYSPPSTEGISRIVLITPKKRYIFISYLIFLFPIIQLCSGNTRNRVLNGELQFMHKSFQKLTCSYNLTSEIFEYILFAAFVSEIEEQSL